MSSSFTSMNTRSKSRKNQNEGSKNVMDEDQIRVRVAPHDDIVVDYNEPESDEGEESVGNDREDQLDEDDTEKIRHEVVEGLINQTKDPLNAVHQSLNEEMKNLEKKQDDEEKSRADADKKMKEKSDEGSSTEPENTEVGQSEEDVKRKKKIIKKHPKSKSLGGKASGRLMLRKSTRKYILELNESIGEELKSTEAEVVKRSEKFLTSVQNSIPEDQAQTLLKIKAAKISLKIAAKKLFSYSATESEMEEMAKYSAENNVTDLKMCFHFLDGYRKGNQHSLMKHTSSLEKIVERFNTQSKKFEEHLSVVHRAADQLNSLSTKIQFSEDAKGKKPQSKDQPLTVNVPPAGEPKPPRKFMSDAMKGLKKADEKKNTLYNDFSSSESDWEEDDLEKKKKAARNVQSSKKTKYDNLPQLYSGLEVGGSSKTEIHEEDAMDEDKGVTAVLDVSKWNYKDYLEAMRVKENEINIFFSRDGIKYSDAILMEAINSCNDQEWANAVTDGRARQLVRQKVTTALVNKISVAKRDARKEAERRARERGV